MCTGKVKWFDAAKGYGFIVDADNKEIFVHFSAIKAKGYRTLEEGQTVEYEEVVTDQGKKQARNVVVQK